MTDINIPALDAAVVERWKAVVGYEGLYEVSNLGRVRSLDRTVPSRTPTGLPTAWVSAGRVLQATKTSEYPLVSLCKGGAQVTVAVHRLVLAAFVGPCPKGMQALHRNGQHYDARLSNLSWGTPSENMADQIRHGTTARGEINGRAILGETEVRKMRRMRKAQRLSYAKLAALFGISKAAAERACVGRSWAHIPMEET